MAARRYTASAVERIAALEAAWDGLPDKIAHAIGHAVAAYTPQIVHDGLSDRVAALERLAADLDKRNSFAAGAKKVENRVSHHAQEWGRTAFPFFVSALVTAYMIAEKLAG